MTFKNFFYCLLFLPLWLYAQVSTNPQTFCNPLNLNYRFMADAEDAREAADAVMVLFQDDYYLFASRTGGYWTSPDLKNWTLIIPQGLDIETYAPAVVVMRDSLFYIPSANGQIYKTGDPKSGVWQKGPTVQGYGDPDLFLDDDGRLFMYFGLSNVTPTSVVELDPYSFTEISERVNIVTAQASIHGWERRGDDNLLDEEPWIEGSWMVKHNGKYYLTYAGPGTEYQTYSDGVYVADSPLGPFEYADYSPYAFKPTGFICGAGHGSTFQDKNGQYWHVGTMSISINHMFERRLGLWPVDFDSDDHIRCNTSLGDYPQFYDAGQENYIDNCFAGMLLLSHKKHVLASSSANEHSANLAVDEDARTFWSAASGDKGEWFMIDLGQTASVEAIQVNFSEFHTTPDLVRGREVELYEQYIIETSLDGKDFEILVDKSTNRQDVPHDYIELELAKSARYIKITNVFTPGNGYFALRDLRIFGNSPQATFTQVPEFSVDRSAADGRDATISWEPIANADGYIIRYGIAPDKLYNNYMVYDATSVSMHSLNHGVEYYFSVEAFDSGLDYYKPIGEIRSAGSGDWNNPDSWEQFDGANWVHPTVAIPSIDDGNITIMDGHEITFSGTDSLDQLSIAPGGTLIINPEATLTITDGVAADLLVQGNLVNYGTILIDPQAEVSFSGDAQYIHAQNGGTIPTAIWYANSTCIINQITDTVPANTSQNFYNFLWDCPLQENDKNLQWQGNTITGSLTIANTGDANLLLCDPTVAEAVRININGNLVQTGGYFSIHNSDAGEASITIEQKGNILITGGKFCPSLGAQNNSGTTFWRTAGDTVSISEATVQNANKDGARLIFAKSNGLQTLLLNNITYAAGGLPVQVDSGAALNLDKSVLQGDGDFLLNADATLYIGAADGIDAAIQNTGQRIFDAKANFGFNASTPQITGSLMPSTVNKIIVATSSTLTLSNSLTVTGALEMADGTLILGENTLTYGPDASLIYSGTKAQTTTDTEFPAINGPKNLIFTNTREAELHAPRTVDYLYLGCELAIGAHTLTCNRVENIDTRAFISMTNSGFLKILDVGEEEVLFPVGTTTYTPVWVKNFGDADAISVNVAKDRTKAENGGRVNVLWNVLEDVDGDGEYTLKFGWASNLEDIAFRANRNSDARIFYMQDLTERGTGEYSYNFIDQPYWVARGGFEKLGTFAVGNFREGTIVLDNPPNSPFDFKLMQNYPNPFNAATTISFSIKEELPVQLVVYDLLGQQVETLIDKRLKPGLYNLQWDANRYASGTYFFKITAADFVQTKSMTLLK